MQVRSIGQQCMLPSTLTITVFLVVFWLKCCKAHSARARHETGISGGFCCQQHIPPELPTTGQTLAEWPVLAVKGIKQVLCVVYV